MVDVPADGIQQRDLGLLVIGVDDRVAHVLRSTCAVGELEEGGEGDRMRQPLEEVMEGAYQLAPRPNAG